MNLDPYINDIDISELTVLHHSLIRYYSSSCGYYFTVDANGIILGTGSSEVAKNSPKWIGDIITGRNRNAFIDAARRIRPTKDEAPILANHCKSHYFFIRNLQILPEIQDEILKKLIASIVDGFIFY